MDQLDDDFRLTEDNTEIKKKRPTFLLVLCILTFIASGFGVLTGLFSFTGYNDIESQFNNPAFASSEAGDIFGELNLEELQGIQNWVNIASLFASLLCLTGALIMFKMRKYGFIFYVAGHAVGIVGGYMSVQLINKMMAVMPIAEFGDMMSLAGGIGLIFAVLIAIAFIIMYGVNLKHLK